MVDRLSFSPATWSHDVRSFCRTILLPLGAWAGAPAVVVADGPVPAVADKIDYNRDVRPILAQNCFACHGFDEQAREADLRLDEAESALAERDGTPAIVAGRPEQSEAWRRICSDDESARMPPADAHEPLTEEQQGVIRRWIEQGAQYARHWSLEPPRKRRLSEVADKRWPQNEIDYFVLAQLEASALAPSPTADRHALIRRLSFDLTGLPPSAAEVEAFVNDREEGAYKRLVDRLLDSPHFGERMAIDWLDAARYADTNGFSIDGGRHMWLWRDWVIQAFNANLPYDEFLRDQLAGDLAPDATAAQRIASGFQRNNMVTHEGGTIPEENLVNYNADRVKTLGEAVLGLTLGCAQCHDHKYDPLTQRDYYRLFAYFNTASDIGLDGNSGVNPRPFFQAKTVLPADEAPRIREQIAAVRDRLSNPPAEDVRRWAESQRAALRRRGAGLGVYPARMLNISTPNNGSGFDLAPDGSAAIITAAPGLAAYDVSLELPRPSEPITGLRILFHPRDGATDGGWGFGEPPQSGDETLPKKKTFVLTALSASAGATPVDQVNLSQLLAFDSVTASGWQDEYRPAFVLDPRNENGWSPRQSDSGPVRLTATFAEPLNANTTPYATVQLNFGHGRQLVAGRWEVYAITGVDDGSPLPSDIISAITATEANRTREQQQRLRAYYAKYADETSQTRTDLANLEERLAALTEPFSTMVMDVAEEPRPTFILARGNYAQPGEEVTPGVPEALPDLPAGAPASRAGLAEWITMPDHPLTARVAVNRFWRALFGAGLVRTPADFGAQGEWPTHPELLDWLAVDFVESGWNSKQLVRKIVMSAAYQQSSDTTDEALARDPTNRLLARGPRFRLSAEAIRDAALKTSGLLVPWVGGPSVNPYAPGDLWREVSHYGSTPATAQSFVQDHGAKLYRRSLYTYWKRTAPPPNMTVFDAPNRETCVVERPSTTTPLQALVLLNDVQFVEAARAFAERILAYSDDDDERLRWATLECLSRPPTGVESSVLLSALARERARYAADANSANEFLSVGESPRDPRLDAAEHAAWAQIALLLFNLSEHVTRS